MNAALERLASALSDRYRIERELGAGGMATVYLAEDLKHGRHVAVKVLKPELAAVLGADRFVQEITTTAALQHPHILPLYDSGEADGFLFYVMPFIDGETLRGKLDRETQLGVEEAVRIACDVADALDHAHHNGVIHRDIKPENILLANGRPMVADFGIALAVSAAAGGRMTETGLSLGTPHYMSPEQATAEKEISARSDVYSLASVLYEMLAGQPPHLGGSAQQIIMKIIVEAPEPVTRYRKSVPPNVAAAVAHALEKLPADRFQSARHFADALRDPHFAAAPSVVGSTTAPAGGPWRARFHAAVAVAVLMAGVAVAAQVARSRAPLDTPTMHLRLPLQPGDRLAAPYDDHLRNADRPSRTAFTFSPDGRSLVYSGLRGGRQTLFLRPIAGETATPIPGTDGAESPFFSPDGGSLGFWAAGRLRRVSLDGGPPSDIAVTPRIAGASWSDDDRIVVGVRDVGLIVYSVTSAAAPDTLVRAAAGLPQWLPGGKAIVFTNDRRLDNNTAQIEVVELSTGKRTILVEEGEDARYVPTGHLVFGRDGAMMAVPIDVDRMEVVGSPVVVLGDVMQAREGMNLPVRTGAMQVAISLRGQLAWVAGGVTPDRVSSVAWLDRQGRREPVPGVGAGAFFMARLAPDEGQFALFEFGRPTRMVVVDLERHSRRSLPGPETPFILWTPDGRRLVYTGAVRDSAALVSTLADGSGPPEPLAGDVRVTGVPAFWSGDGTELFTIRDNLLTGYRLPGGRSRPIDGLPRDLNWPTLSPDGKWVAYGAREAGASGTDIFVQPWPALDRRWKISTAGGSQPAWTRNGRELVYLSEVAGDPVQGTMRVMSVDVGAGPEFPHTTPRELFTGVFGTATPVRNWDVTADGSRFLVVVGGTPPSPPGDLQVVVNWFPELLRLVGGEAARK